jgi:hypothetical protein
MKAPSFNMATGNIGERLIWNDYGLRMSCNRGSGTPGTGLLWLWIGVFALSTGRMTSFAAWLYLITSNSKSQKPIIFKYSRRGLPFHMSSPVYALATNDKRGGSTLTCK